MWPMRELCSFQEGEGMAWRSLVRHRAALVRMGVDLS